MQLYKIIYIKLLWLKGMKAYMYIDQNTVRTITTWAIYSELYRWYLVCKNIFTSWLCRYSIETTIYRKTSSLFYYQTAMVTWTTYGKSYDLCYHFRPHRKQIVTGLPTLNMLGLYLDTLLIGNKFCSMISILKSRELNPGPITTQSGVLPLGHRVD